MTSNYVWWQTDHRCVGLHKIWALKSRLEIPADHISAVLRAADERVRGIRLPGTQIPGLITAGTYYEADGKRVFWDVCDKEKAIAVDQRRLEVWRQSTRLQQTLDVSERNAHAPPFFHVARKISHAACLLATARNRAASSGVGLAAVPPLTWIRMICNAYPQDRGGHANRAGSQRGRNEAQQKPTI